MFEEEILLKYSFYWKLTDSSDFLMQLCLRFMITKDKDLLIVRLFHRIVFDESQNFVIFLLQASSPVRSFTQFHRAF